MVCEKKQFRFLESLSRKNSRPIYFDFDNTLTSCDTTLLYAWVLARNERRYFRFFAFCFMSFLHRLGFSTNTMLKSIFAQLFLAGKSRQQVRKTTKVFHEKYTPKILLPNVMEVLVQHIRRGDRVFLVSANFDCFLEPLKNVWGLEGVICTKLKLEDKHYSGKLEGKACHGPEKLRKTLELNGRDGVKEAVAYGDSASDSPLLSRVKEPYIILQEAKYIQKLTSVMRVHISVFAGREIVSNSNAKRKIVPWASTSFGKNFLGKT